MKKWVKFCFMLIFFCFVIPHLSSCSSKTTPEVIHGNDGREIILRVYDGAIEWQYQGDEEWFQLIEIDELIGPQGDQGLQGENGISVSEVYLNDDGELIILLSDGNQINAGSVLPLIDVYRVIFRIDRDQSVYEFYHLKDGEILNEPKTPINPGYLFDGWYYLDQKLEFPYTFDESNNIEIVAKWKEVPYTYQIVGDEVYITGYKSITPTNAVIPKIIDGYPVTEISENAFKDCSFLQSIYIPNTVKYIKHGAFRNTSFLQSIQFEDNSELISIGDYAFHSASYHNLKIDFGLNSVLEIIGAFAFYNNQILNITLPDTLRIIDNYAFAYSIFNKVILPDSIEIIGSYAFSNNEFLQHVIISKNSNLLSIGDFAFAYNTDLKSIFIPDSITHVGSSIINNSTDAICYTMFEEIPTSFDPLFKHGNPMPIIFSVLDYGIHEDLVYIETSLHQIHILGHLKSKDYLLIPNEINALPVVQISRKAFTYSNISYIELSDNISKIDDYAFYTSFGLYQVRISDTSNLTSIGEYAFHTSSITNFYIPDSVTEIKAYAFSNMIHGLTIYSKHASLPTGFHTLWNQGGYLVTWNVKAYGLKDHLYYVLDQNDEVIILGADHLTPSLIIPSKMNDNTVTQISRAAFYGQTLYHVVIPNTVLSIGEKAFTFSSNTVIYTSVASKPVLWNDQFKSESSVIHYGILYSGQLDGFKYVVLNDSETHIIGSTMDITQGIIPKEIESRPVNIIAKNAFNKNEYLVSIFIPNSITVIKNHAFAYAKNLTILNFEENSKVEIIEYGAFSNTALISVTLPNSLITIGSQAFFKNHYLEEINFEENSKLETIGSAAFYEAKLVESILIPSSVITINAGAFSDMESLRDVEFMNQSKLETLGNSAFYKSKITSILLPRSLKTIGTSAFSMIKPLENVLFEEGSTLESIGSFAFSYLPNLDMMIIPLTVTTIDLYAFSDCENLTLYVRSYSRPVGWHELWTNAIKDIVWGYTGA